MPTYQPEQLAAWSGGEWSRLPAAAPVGVSIDSRTVEAGNLFVALSGERVDGHRFVEAAFDRGAAAAVVERPVDTAGPLLQVESAVEALGALARGYRDTLTMPLLGISGSVGKTSVKEMTAAILGRVAPTAYTTGNLNNHLGLPLSVLRTEPNAAYGVFEIGINHPGELQPLCTLLRPDWGLLTRVGPAHSEFFQSEEEIADEKARLFRCLPPQGGAVVSLDQPWFEVLTRDVSCRLVTSSLHQPADYEGTSADGATGTFEVRERSTGETCACTVSLPGDYMVENALLAVALARSWGLDWEPIQQALAAYVPLANRWQVVHVQGLEVVNDAYNANPMSMRAAIETFGRSGAGRRNWLVLAGMLELGAGEHEEHVELGRVLANGSWCGLVTVGERGKWIAEGARAAGWPADAAWTCASVDEAVALLREEAAPGDRLLLKASRGERLEAIITRLENGRGLRRAHE